MSGLATCCYRVLVSRDDNVWCVILCVIHASVVAPERDRRSLLGFPLLSSSHQHIACYIVAARLPSCEHLCVDLRGFAGVELEVSLGLVD